MYCLKTLKHPDKPEIKRKHLSSKYFFPKRIIMTNYMGELEMLKVNRSRFFFVTRNIAAALGDVKCKFYKKSRDSWSSSAAYTSNCVGQCKL
jgi:hypothetical protein